MPLVFAAMVEGPLAVTSVIVMYEFATIATMIALVMLSYHGASRLNFSWMDRFGQAAAGAVIVVVGTAMILLGM